MDEFSQAPGLAPVEPAAKSDAVKAGGGWLRAGARVLAFHAPRWQGLEARPLTLALLLLTLYLVACALQRAWMEGSPTFVWTGFLSGWAGIAVIAWLSWVTARSAAEGSAPAPSPATLIALSCSASLVLSVIVNGSLLALAEPLGPMDEWPEAGRWAAWLLPLTWAGLAQMRLLWRVAGSNLARGAIVLLTPVPLILSSWLAPAQFWWPEPPAKAAVEDVGLKLTEEVVSTQPQLLANALGSLQPPRRGRVNVYGVTYAPYASQDVFMRESAAVARTMRERFGAQGRMVELVMNPATATTLPWAMPMNLHKTIERMAAVMDRERDVLFLHVTSHGGADGKLARDTWPLETEPLTPQMLKQWLDDAGIRWRVISVSACYSGSWIAPLAGDGTLVMTAADATHTSYGCGKRSPLTFFGQAMYVDALQDTWSFEEAHAQARKLIDERERKAGKSDGYSNPQLSQGAGIRKVLQRLQDERRER